MCLDSAACMAAELTLVKLIMHLGCIGVWLTLMCMCFKYVKDEMGDACYFESGRPQCSNLLFIVL